MESQAPKTIKEEQDDDSPQHITVMDIKLEPVDDDFKYMDSSKYLMTDDAGEREALVEPLCLPIKLEQDSKQTPEATIKEENLYTLKNMEDLESSWFATEVEVDGEALMYDLFIPVESEPYSEGTSEERAIEDNFEATGNEDIQCMDSRDNVIINDSVEKPALVDPLGLLIKSVQDSEEMPQAAINEETLYIFQTNEDLESSGYAMKVEVYDAEIFMKFFLVPVESETYSEGTSEERTMEENFQATRNEAIQDFESSGRAKKGEVDDDEALMKRLFVPVESEPYSEGISVERTIEDNFEATVYEDIQASPTHLTRYSELENSVSVTRKDINAAGLNRYVVHNNSEETTKAGKELSMQYLNHRGKPHEDNFKISTACSSSCVVKDVKGVYRKQDGNKLETCGMESSSAGQSCSRTHVNQKRSKKEMQSSSSKESSFMKSKKRRETTKRFSCTFCGKPFPFTRDLKNHERVHTGDKPFRCALCNKTWAAKTNLLEHMRVHSEERPFKCSSCEKSFKSKRSLKAHMKTHSDEKPFCCDVCGKAFGRNDHLRVHMHSHTGNRPYSCTQCGKAFALKSHLTTHMHTHSNEKSYTCAVCGKAYSIKYSLIYHIRKHTGERPYKCSECGMAFSHNTSLSGHKHIHTTK